MKRIIFSFLIFQLFLNGTQLYANDIEHKSIYEHGKVIDKMDDNFINLKKNGVKSYKRIVMFKYYHFRYLIHYQMIR